MKIVCEFLKQNGYEISAATDKIGEAVEEIIFNNYLLIGEIEVQKKVSIILIHYNRLINKNLYFTKKNYSESGL